MTADTRVHFYFDYISSNAYLAWIELPRMAARFGARLELVPVLFAGLLESTGLLGPAEVRPKAVWMWKNNLRKAALLGVPLELPVYHPFNPLLALRVSSLPLAEEERAALVDRLFRAVWVDRLHVSEPEVVERIANDVGLEGARLVAEAGTQESKERLRAQTDDAIAAGVFGVPSMRVGDEVFWGYDDLPFVERLLAGNDPLPDLPSRDTPLEASAVRRRVRES
jgi:2-hydroxychromene-2-carboxylate isomerase